MSPADRAYVCLSCLKSGRQPFSTTLLRTTSNPGPSPKPSPPPSIIFDAAIQPSPHHLQESSPDIQTDKKRAVSRSRERQHDGLKLGADETGRLRRLGGLLRKATANVASGPSTGLPLSEAVKQSLGTLYLEERAVLMKLIKAYGDRDLTGFSSDMSRASQIPSNKPVQGETLQKLVKDIKGADFFGIGLAYGEKGPLKQTSTKDDTQKEANVQETSRGGRRRRIRVKSPQVSVLTAPEEIAVSPRVARRVVSRRDSALEPLRNKKRLPRVLARLKPAVPKGSVDASSPDTEEKPKVRTPISREPFETAEVDQMQTVEAQGLVISPVEQNTLPVPGLTFDLSRVLFNPGIYQLQDPRSRVFNFDPYLQDIMPVTEFDFNALKDYITSSKDGALSNIALERGRRYVGSSSSMTGMLVHFHFLLSQWRDINTETLSRGFPEKLTTFTAIQRAPSAIFLRWKDGHYAIDADKEHDSANILMSLGRSMEKLFTLEKDEFERYRKSNQTEFSEEERAVPESYHYSEMGRFLMRSQLDAYDPRLPGTGMFDLKTRAVVSIRMNTTRHQEGLGYQIKERFGGWESYEREFFDMIRSAFLKYSLQVRMGRMDGIFVAYHNVERIFGFQYVSLPELDLHLHGQSDTTLGDQEFKISIALLEEVFERATKKYPEQSLRFHFETRNTQTPLMYIFAEPVDEEDIRAIQESKKAEIAETQKRIFGMAETQTAKPESEENSAPEPILPPSDPSDTDADVAFLDSIGKPLGEFMKAQAPASNDSNSTSTPPESKNGHKEVMGMTLVIRNKVNGQAVRRPTGLKASDKWTVEYTLTEMNRPSKAQEVYKACKNRRKVELSRPSLEQDTAANYYLRKIKDMTRQGAKWRKQQDEMDRGKEAVVLYGNGRGTEAH